MALCAIECRSKTITIHRESFAYSLDKMSLNVGSACQKARHIKIITFRLLVLENVVGLCSVLAGHSAGTVRAQEFFSLAEQNLPLRQGSWSIPADAAHRRRHRRHRSQKNRKTP